MAECHPDRKHYATGKCERCYRNQKRRDRYWADPDKERARNRRNYEEHREAHIEAALRRNRRRLYDLTDEQYRDMLVSQEGKCLICGDDMDPPHVDHDHVTGRVRGLLCGGCNLGLGHFRDDPGRLAAAVEYLS